MDGWLVIDIPPLNMNMDMDGDEKITDLIMARSASRVC